MMKTLNLLSLLVGSAIVISCGSEGQEPKDPISYSNYVNPATIESAHTFFAALPGEAVSAGNASTAEKIRLGKALYMEERLSKNNTQSCNTCHNLDTYGVDNLATSPGDKGENGDRNSPTTLNAALHFVQFWDGRSPHVEDQAGGPILNPVEMAMASEKEVEDRLAAIPEYQEMFASAFPKEANPITYNNLKLAIGSFERTLLTPSRFDEFMNGDQGALTSQEVQGLETFIKVGCTTCHTGSLLGGHMYQKFGVLKEYWEFTKSEKIDEGRKVVTGSDGDQYMFKVPSLRNIEKTGPYFHDGSVESLKESIAIMSEIQLGKKLTEQEVADIEAFLKSLTGETPGTI